MIEPGDIRDIIISERENEDDTVAWETLMHIGTKQGNSSADVEKAITAAKEDGLIYEPLLGEFKPL